MCVSPTGGRAGRRPRRRLTSFLPFLRADGGMATAELAVVMPAVVLVLLLVLAGVSAGVTQLRVTDAARVAARQAAIGSDDVAGSAQRVAPGVSVSVEGVAALRDLAVSQKVNFLTIPAEIVAKINDPAFLVGVIPAKTYEGQNSDVTTVSVFNYLVTHEGVSTDTVYTMTKSMFENLDQMSAAHSAAKAIKKENAAKTPPAPLHPGAEKYYREIGLIK